MDWILFSFSLHLPLNMNIFDTYDEVSNEFKQMTKRCSHKSAIKTYKKSLWKLMISLVVNILVASFQQVSYLFKIMQMFLQS